MKYLIEKSNYYKVNDIVLVEYWYNNMITPVLIKEVKGHRYTVSHNIESSKIQNAPDEIISSSEVIDKFKN